MQPLIPFFYTLALKDYIAEITEGIEEITDLATPAADEEYNRHQTEQEALNANWASVRQRLLNATLSLECPPSVCMICKCSQGA